MSVKRYFSKTSTGSDKNQTTTTENCNSTDKESYTGNY